MLRLNTHTLCNGTRIAWAGARCYGPVQQGAFLMDMGIVERTEFLIEQDHVTEAQAETIVAGLERLVDPQQMGSRYKVRQHCTTIYTSCNYYSSMYCKNCCNTACFASQYNFYGLCRSCKVTHCATVSALQQACNSLRCAASVLTASHGGSARELTLLPLLPFAVCSVYLLLSTGFCTDWW
jgi:hypothetical protein